MKRELLKDKRGDPIFYYRNPDWKAILIGVLLVAVVVNAYFGWYTLEWLGFDLVFWALVLVAAVFFISALRASGDDRYRRPGYISLGLLFAVIALNAKMGWFSYELFNLDLVSLVLVAFAIVLLFFGWFVRAVGLSIWWYRPLADRRRQMGYR